MVETLKKLVIDMDCSDVHVWEVFSAMKGEFSLKEIEEAWKLFEKHRPALVAKI